jgi:hypothetical protein
VRHGEWLLVGGFAAALLLAALLGRRVAPQPVDLRRSTYLTTRDGARGLTDALGILGVAVERRRYPLFGIAAEARAPGDVLLILEPAMPMTTAEQREVMRFLASGGRAVLAGETDVEHRFGVAIVSIRDLGSKADSQLVRAPAGIGLLPGVEWVIGRGRPPVGERSGMLTPERVDTLLAATSGRAVAARYAFRGGGVALVLADGRWLANGVLRETDAGALLIPWIMGLGPRRVIADEYHQGFGRRGAIFTAAWGWLTRAPAGWAILQLTFAALVALAAAAVRFGPALHVLVRVRRSPVEHLDALAAGLERSGGHQTAVDLLGRGLQRRLQRGGAGGVTVARRTEWLAAVARAADRPETQRAVKRLRSLMREPGGGDDHVLQTAQAVEDVWEALKLPRKHAPS